MIIKISKKFFTWEQDSYSATFHLHNCASDSEADSQPIPIPLSDMIKTEWKLARAHAHWDNYLWLSISFVRQDVKEHCGTYAVDIKHENGGELAYLSSAMLYGSIATTSEHGHTIMVIDRPIAYKPGWSPVTICALCRAAMRGNEVSGGPAPTDKIKMLK